MGTKRLNALPQDEFERVIQTRRIARMAAVDEMPPDLRALVHEYGLMTVQSFLALGITKPRHIRHLVETVLDEFSPTRGSTAAQGVRAARGL